MGREMGAKFGKRFQELSLQADEIETTKTHKNSGVGFAGFYIDPNTYLNWTVKVRHLIETVCGEKSQHFAKLAECDEPSMYTTNYEMFRKALAVLLAAKEDFEGGYLNSIKNLVQADLFDDELEQATELLASGYQSAAAVVAGVVLEGVMYF